MLPHAMESLRRQGFTMVEMMVVVSIVGVLASISIPNFVKSRNESQRRACVSNMRLIETAAENWLAANGSETIGTEDWVRKLVGATNYIKHEPHCPCDGTYDVAVDQETGVLRVACSKKGHVLVRYE